MTKAQTYHTNICSVNDLSSVLLTEKSETILCVCVGGGGGGVFGFWVFGFFLRVFFL